MKITDRLAVVVILISFITIVILIINGIKIDTGIEPFVALLTMFIAAIVGVTSGIKGFIDVLKTIISKVEGKRVFISYPYDHTENANEISNILRKSGAKVWMAAEQLKPGEVISIKIENAINEADFFVALITNKRSSYINKELDIAYKKQKRIIPVLLENAEIPEILMDIQYIDLHSDKQKGLDNLIKAIA